MKTAQYTIRGISVELDARLRARARREKKSLNRLVIDQLNRSLEPAKQQSRPTGGDYDDLRGSWVDDPGFDEALKDMRVVDPKDWQ